MSFEEQLTEIQNNMQNPPYKNLVLCGGGVLGIAFCGALEELRQRGLLHGIKNYAASSAGSIIAGALACGATYNFLSRELSEVNFSDFIDYGNRFKAVYNLYYYNGICSGDAFLNWYGDILEKLTGNSDITLNEIHEKFGGRLAITATSLNTRKTIYFDYRSHPDLQLKMAVRMSMSIPMLFMPVEYIDDVFVDGGVLDNFPMHAFHRENSDKINPKTLGLLLTTTMEETECVKTTGFWSIIDSLYSCYIAQTQKMYMDPQDWDRTIKISCGKVSSFNFYIDNVTKTQLVEAGKSAVCEHFNTKQHTTQGKFLDIVNTIHTGYSPDDEKTPVNTPSGLPKSNPIIIQYPQLKKLNNLDYVNYIK
ncbi:Patatin [Pacmanvirus A23]|uniref:Patatin n=1 Tax=Pacmanvirus A23 TaxID=1932881 RepID=UPI000A09646B|nr:Patatin [Pacmanvirus A23]SIP86114.1 Patatin [Pacmanvirus A23]